MRKFFFAMLYLTAAFAGRCQLSWQPFTPDVLVRAKEENKMVLLNLKARWCHWCHVMEDSTYADPVVQEYLQEHFILVKEDQDQRADLQAKYKEYGWPATIVLNAQGEDVVKRAGFMEPRTFIRLLRNVVSDPSPELFAAPALKPIPSVDYLKTGVLQSLDTALGGFIFPQKYVDWPTAEWAFSRCASTPAACAWLSKSLEGSLNLLDTVFGGVYQYSTGGNWKYPHFEKLLSFQARYLELYSRAYASGLPGNWEQAALSIWRYGENFLMQPSGLWGNSQDADLMPGVHAAGYFGLSAKDRLKQGIPRIDTHAFTRENALMVRAAVVYAAATGSHMALQRARGVYNLLAKRRMANGRMPHGADFQPWVSVGDELGFAQASWWLYRYTGENVYLEELRTSLQQLRLFFTGTAFASSVGNEVTDSYYSLALNTEAMLLLQSYLTSFPDQQLLHELEQAMAYFSSPEQVQNTSTEAGLLEVLEQERLDELPRLVLVGRPDDPLASKLSAAALVAPAARLSIRWVAPNSTEAEAYGNPQEPTVFLCTGSRCSAPISDPAQLRLVLNMLENN